MRKSTLGSEGELNCNSFFLFPGFVHLEQDCYEFAKSQLRLTTKNLYAGTVLNASFTKDFEEKLAPLMKYPTAYALFARDIGRKQNSQASQL